MAFKNIMRKPDQVPDFLAMATKLKADVQTYAKVTALNFFIDSFQKQGFTDGSFEPWQKRTNDDRPGGGLLVNSAYLRNSLKVISSAPGAIVFGSNASYAKLHNEGGVITITMTTKMRKYFWYMFKASNDSRYKFMALTKKDRLTIKIPKRQFIGHSEVLMNDLDKWLVNQIENRFKTA